MLKLNQLYIKNYILLFLLTLFLTAVGGYFLLEKVEVRNHKVMLLNMIDEFYLLQKDGVDIDKVIHDLKDKTSVRYTIIDKNGQVLHESDRAVYGMSNHIDRPEIREAIKHNSGFSIRHSKSVNKDMLYVAKKFDDKFIRLSYSLDSIKNKFLTFWMKLVSIIFVILVVAFWIVITINKRIVDDLKEIDNSLNNLLDRKYNIHFDKTRCCKEFDNISKKLEKVSVKLKRRDRQKEKYTKNLKSLNKKQSDIISAISHEFKNPIAAIIGYTQTIKEDKNITLQVRDKFLEKVLKNSYKISSMIDRLSLAIKLENESFLPKYIKFKLLNLLEDVKDTLLQKYPDREIILNVKDIEIYADRDMFENLFINLIENGLKYSEDEVVVNLNGSKIEVIDHGIGISSSDLDKITKRFFRVDALSWDNSIGVGLYIVKYILKLHNVVLQIDSKLNVGSKFYFDIDKLIR